MAITLLTNGTLVEQMIRVNAIDILTSAVHDPAWRNLKAQNKGHKIAWSQNCMSGFR